MTKSGYDELWKDGADLQAEGQLPLKKEGDRGHEKEVKAKAFTTKNPWDWDKNLILEAKKKKTHRKMK